MIGGGLPWHDFSGDPSMKEEINVNGKKVYILIGLHVLQDGRGQGTGEYLTAG